MLLRIFIIIAMLVAATSSHAAVILTVDSTKRYQTWEGWEATVEVYHHDAPTLGDRHPVSQDILNRLLDDAVNNLGLTALRLEAMIMLSRNRPGLEPVNDNDDPFVLDSSKFRWHWFDPYVRSIVLPMKRRVEARGEKFILNLHAIAWNAWHWDEPASDPGQEYAEFMMACLDRLRDKFGITPDYLTIYNEPDNSNATETKDEVIRGMKKLAARMKAAGYTTKLRFPDVSFLKNAIPWFDRLVATEPHLLSWVRQFTFHGYGGFNRATLNAIRSRAQTHGITTAQTEWWFTGNHPTDIFVCMTEADIVLYEPYALGAWPNNNPKRGLYGITYSGGTFPLYNYTGYVRGPDWYDIYHYSAFIRPGDVRIEITSSESTIKPVAFEKPNGKVVVVAINSSTAEQEIQIQGLPAGVYGIVFTTPRQKGVELPSVTVEAGKSLVFQMPAQEIATFYPIVKKATEKGRISADVPEKERSTKTLLFEELFEDTNWTSRGWYDGPQMEITSSEHIPGGHSCVWHWKKAGDIGVAGRGGRVLFTPVTNVTLSFYIKHSANWKWTGVNWHPHEFHFLTTVDPPFIGPAHTHLTFYVEAVNGVPRLAIQDGKNIDESRVGQNLVGVTEKRAVAGCNGDSDGYGKGDCYRVGDRHANGKYWEPGRIYFSDEPGPYYKGDWRHVKAKFQLNSVVNGIGVKDGVLQYWFDGKLIMDYHDVVFRTGQHPDMKINQFLMAPYFGPGVPHEQWIWIDDLKIYTDDTQGSGDRQLQGVR